MPSKKTTLAVDTHIDVLNTDILFEEVEDTSTAATLEPVTLETVNVLKPVEITSELDELVPLSLPSSSPELDAIMSLIVDVDEDLEYLTMLVYGRNGTGKTTFGASGGEGTLILAAEDGTLSVRDSKAKKMRLRTFSDFEMMYWLLRKGKPVPGGIEINLKSTPYLVKYLVIDTLSKLQTLCLRAVVLKERENDASKDVITPTLRDYGIMSQRMQYWLNAVKSLPLHKIWLCQEKTTSDDLEVAGYNGFPDLSKSLRNFVCGEADVIGRMYIQQITDDKAQFRMLVGANELFVTKDRTRRLGHIITNPKIPPIMNAVFAKKGGVTNGA